MDKPLTLSSAYAAWVMAENDNNWAVMDQDNEKIGDFPSHWDAKDCMIAIRFGRKFELIAFNTGIDFGKTAIKNTHEPEIAKMAEHINVLEQMNERLSVSLEKFIIGED